MIPVSPEQTQALRTVLSPAAPKVAAALGCAEDTVHQFLQGVKVFVEAIASTSPGQTFALSLLLSGATGQNLTPASLQKHLRNGNRVFSLNSSLRLLGVSSDPILLSAISDRTVANGSFEILVNGTYCYLILGGRIIDEGEVRTMSSSPRSSTQWRRPFADIEELLRDHVENYLASERGTRYWAKKAERILLAQPDGTEYIFQRALFWWLSHYVADSIDVYAEPSGHGQDKTDIVVVTIDGKYVIEVKWLGTNEATTTYTETRIQEGIEQVAIYLTHDARIVWAYLVIYDARPLDKHKSARFYDPTCRHLRCSEPTLIFLESDTPTQVVKKRRQKKGKA